MVHFNSLVSISNDAGDRTYTSPDPTPSLRSDARDNPPDRSTWSAREQGGYEAGERVDDEVRVGRRVWVRHGHVNRFTNQEAGLGSGKLDQMGRSSGEMERAVYSVLDTRRKVRLRWEMGYIIISCSSRHITSFINRGTRYTPGCLRGGELLLSVTALLLGVPAELLGRVSGDGADDGVCKSERSEHCTIRSAQTCST